MTTTTATQKLERWRTHAEHITTTISGPIASSTIVAEFQELLSSRTQDDEAKENIKPKGAKSSTAATRRTNLTSRPKATQKPSDKPLLTTKERFYIATAVANTALKVLSETSKSQPASTPRSNRSSEDTHGTSSPRTTRSLPRGPSSTASKPLPLRTTSSSSNASTRQPRTPQSSKATISQGPPTITSIAVECGRLAFAYLRSPVAQNVAGKSLPPLQVENGMLALIGKLIGHGLESLAIKDLQILKRLFQKHVSDEEKESDSIDQKNESLASLIHIPGIETKASLFPAVMTYQLYVLRVISAIKRPRAVDALGGLLEPSNCGSPSAIILSWSKTAGNEAKASRHLEAVAQALLAACPGVSTSEDTLACDSNSQPSPDAVLQLQRIAFQLRYSRRTLEGGDKREKDVIDSFSRCLAAYSRRSAVGAVKKYRWAEKQFESLKRSTGLYDMSNIILKTAMETITQTLSSLAQDASLQDEALRWIENEAAQDSSLIKSDCQTVTQQIRVATLSLEKHTMTEKVTAIESSLHLATKALTGTLKGDSLGLDNLLCEVSGFRRAATKYFLAKKGSKERDPSMDRLCFAIVTASIRFLLRYVGSKPNENAEEKIIMRYTQRRSTVQQLAKGVFDSIVIACRELFTPMRIGWDDLDNCLSYGVSLLNELQGNVDADGEESLIFHQNLQFPLVRISNLYWTFYAHAKASGDFKILEHKMIRRSVDALKSRSLEEKQAGNLGIKLEKLADAYYSKRCVKEAYDTLTLGLETLISVGVLLDVAPLASKQPLDSVWAVNAEVQCLSRMFTTRVRLALKLIAAEKMVELFFDDEELDTEARVMVLESQLYNVAKQLQHQRSLDKHVLTSIMQLSDTVLSIYSPKEFPIRRRRIAAAYLQLVTEHPSIAGLDGPSKLASSIGSLPARLANDSGLRSYGAHWQAMFIASLSLQEPTPCVKRLQEALTTWHTILEEVDNRNGLSTSIDDVERWLDLLTNIAEFLSVKGHDYLRLSALHIINRGLELIGASHISQIVSQLSDLGLQYMRLGYSGKAGLTLAKAEGLLGSAAVSTEAKLKWHLAYAEYLLGVGNVERSQFTLLAAENMGVKDEALNELSKPTAGLSGRIRFMALVSSAAYVHSLLAMQLGNPQESLKHAKHSVTLNRRIWASLESRQNALRSGTFDSTLSSSESSEQVNAVVAASMTHACLDGPIFWSIVPALHRGLTQIAMVCAHQGDSQQSLYYMEQAYRIADAVKSTPMMVWNLSARADSWLKVGKPDKALELLEQAKPLAERVGNHKDLILYHGSSALMKRVEGDLEEELRVYDIAESMLGQLASSSFIQEFEKPDVSVDRLIEQTSQLTVEAPARKTRVRTVKVAKTTKSTGTVTSGARKLPTKTAIKASRTIKTAKPKSETTTPSDQCYPLSAMRGDLLRRKAATALLQSKLAEANELLGLAEGCFQMQESLIAQQAIKFRKMMAQYSTAISSDFTYSVLPESTISFPAIASQRDAEVRQSIATVNEKLGTKEDFVSILRQAKRCLSEIEELALRIGSVSTIHQICTFSSQITILMSAANMTQTRVSIHPLNTAYLCELPKIVAAIVDHDAIEVEKDTMSREDLLAWPTLNTKSKMEARSDDWFQQEYIDVMPENWIAISMSLNEDRDELYIIRYQAHETPFNLRIPLGRHQSRDLDEDIFGFDDGKAELQEIISLSDFSAHEQRDLSVKGAKTEWWAEREALDCRLKELLVNMENIWLGGFRGIFSQHSKQPALLGRFQKNLQTILDRYLPSRRGRGKAKQAKVQLDNRILELFIGLGDVDGGSEMDDPLMDLVYFVIDVLQFSGERNAYDEIDFDAIVVEIMDALREYHAADQESQAENRHTILVLDKRLHCFPWESMPSLQGQSISRLSSLQHMKERLSTMRRSPNANATEQGHYLPSTYGTTILNPSGDLAGTQKTLQPCLETMKGNWTHFFGRQPTESEIEQNLKERDLLLYIGHGSGTQFIRSRTIKRLYEPPQTSTSSNIIAGERKPPKPSCATTWLMGCSSAAVVEHGTFEPSGTICSYMAAGAPAVVGMLWDVTDKDCDRFSIKLGEQWGLWDQRTSEEAVKRQGKSRTHAALMMGTTTTSVSGSKRSKSGKARSANSSSGKSGKGATNSSLVEEIEDEGRTSSKISLDAAVARSRDACYLRYLNGAAAVVYGIPVFLE